MVYKYKPCVFYCVLTCKFLILDLEVQYRTQVPPLCLDHSLLFAKNLMPHRVSGGKYVRTTGNPSNIIAIVHSPKGSSI